ncbi:hypothetical protein AKO1_002222, partial [Acrasis kona]
MCGILSSINYHISCTCVFSFTVYGATITCSASTTLLLFLVFLFFFGLSPSRFLLVYNDILTGLVFRPHQISSTGLSFG